MVEFTADLPGIQALAQFMTGRAADVRAIAKPLRELPCYTEAAFGDGGALAAYMKFHEAWTSELAINAGALDELGQKFTQVAADFEKQDVHWAHGIGWFERGTSIAR